MSQQGLRFTLDVDGLVAMSTAVVSLAAAMICFAQQCHPVLVGEYTPTGVFPLTKRVVAAPGYGGDVLQFKETEREVFAVHRVWLLRPSQRRAERLASPAANVCYWRSRPTSRLSSTVESFGRRQASESLRCPNRGDHGLSYGESCFAQIVG